MTKLRVRKKRIYSLVEITCEMLQICSNELGDKRIKFFQSIWNEEGFAVLDLAGEPSPVLLCFRYGQGKQNFLLVSSDRTGRGTEMAEWLVIVKKKFRGSGFGFEIRFPENIEKFKGGMLAFKKIL